MVNPMLERIKEHAVEYVVMSIFLGGLLYATTAVYKASFDIQGLTKQQEDIEKRLIDIVNNIKEVRLIFAKEKLEKGDLTTKELGELMSKLDKEEQLALSELKASSLKRIELKKSQERMAEREQRTPDLKMSERKKLSDKIKATPIQIMSRFGPDRNIPNFRLRTSPKNMEKHISQVVRDAFVGSRPRITKRAESSFPNCYDVRFIDRGDLKKISFNCHSEPKTFVKKNDQPD